MSRRVLVVDDEKLIVKGIRFSLEQDGMEVDCAYDGEEALQLAKENPYDIILLDVMLPKLTGFEVCQQIRDFSNVPVVMLTAKGDDMDKILGLEYGADDYITKPFNIQILKRRIEVALRRQASAAKSSADSYNDGYLCLDFGTLTAVRDGEKLAITPNEYKLLRLLTANAGNIVTRQILLEKLWDCDSNYIDDHTLTVTMNRLRSKIEDASHSYIRTVRGMGYIWTGAGI